MNVTNISNISPVNAVNNNSNDSGDTIAEFQERVTELQNELSQLLALGPNVSQTTFKTQYEYILSQIEGTMNGTDGNGPGLSELCSTLKEESQDPIDYPDVAAFVHNTGGAFIPFVNTILDGGQGIVGALSQAAAGGDDSLATFLSTCTFQKNETFFHIMQQLSNKVNP